MVQNENTKRHDGLLDADCRLLRDSPGDFLAARWPAPCSAKKSANIEVQPGDMLNKGAAQ